MMYNILKVNDDIVILTVHVNVSLYLLTKVKEKNLTNKICTICNDDVEILNTVNEKIDLKTF